MSDVHGIDDLGDLIIWMTWSVMATIGLATYCITKAINGLKGTEEDDAQPN